MMTYLVVAGAGLGILGFMYLLFGELFLLAVIIFAVVGAVGCLHYFLWGRAMSEEGSASSTEAGAEPLDLD